MSSANLRLLIFLPATLIPACASSSPEFHIIYSAYKLNKQSDNIQPWCTPFPIWNQSTVPFPVLTIASWPAYRFLRSPPTAHVWCPGPVQPMRAVCIYLCAVQIFKVCVCQLLSHVWLFATPQTVVCQASPFMRVFRQEYWSGLPFSSSGGFSQPRDQTPVSCVSFIAGGFFTHWAIREALLKYIFGFIHSSAMTTLQVICTKCFSL